MGLFGVVGRVRRGVRRRRRIGIDGGGPCLLGCVDWCRRFFDRVVVVRWRWCGVCGDFVGRECCHQAIVCYCCCCCCC